MLFYQETVYWGLRKICKRRLWKRASRSTGDPLGNLERASFSRELLEEDEGELWKWSVPLSLWELCEADLEIGLLYWGP
jgi:hypothetical protein